MEIFGYKNEIKSVLLNFRISFRPFLFVACMGIGTKGERLTALIYSFFGSSTCWPRILLPSFLALCLFTNFSVSSSSLPSFTSLHVSFFPSSHFTMSQGSYLLLIRCSYSSSLLSSTFPFFFLTPVMQCSKMPLWMPWSCFLRWT